jgi:hypothetical protein
MADTVTLHYTGDSVTLPILSIKGMDDPDWFELFPAILNEHIDGSKETQFIGFRRKVRIDCGVVSARADRLKILYWYLDNARTIDYGAENAIPFVPQSPDGYENEWLMDLSAGRRFVFELDESAIRTTFPV